MATSPAMMRPAPFYLVAIALHLDKMRLRAEHG